MNKYYHFATRNRCSRFLYAVFNEHISYASTILPHSRYVNHKKFIIYGQGRTGSTLLVNMLNSHPNIFCEREILMDKNLPFDHQVRDSQKMLQGKSSLFRRKIYGFKVKIYQITEQKSIKSPSWFLQEATKKGWKIIFLYRENVFEHVLSNFIAENLKQYHFSKSKKGKKGKNKAKFEKLSLEINKNDLVFRMNERIEYRKKEDESLENIDYHPVCYETLSKEPQSVCSGVYNFLGIKGATVRTTLQKTNTKKYSDLIKNFDEIHETLKINNFEKYINPDRA